MRTFTFIESKVSPMNLIRFWYLCAGLRWRC